MRKDLLLLSVGMILALGACDNDRKSSVGFSLPDGDVAMGQQKFVSLRCTDCHSVVGMDNLREEGMEPIMTVPLGGKTTRIATYGQLVTSIINPSHKLSQKNLSFPVQDQGKSKMRNYNEVMTVADVIDLVAFLQAQYQLDTYPRTYYTPF